MLGRSRNRTARGERRRSARHGRARSAKVREAVRHSRGISGPDDAFLCRRQAGDAEGSPPTGRRVLRPVDRQAPIRPRSRSSRRRSASVIVKPRAIAAGASGTYRCRQPGRASTMAPVACHVDKGRSVAVEEVHRGPRRFLRHDHDQRRKVARDWTSSRTATRTTSRRCARAGSLPPVRGCAIASTSRAT